MASLLSHLNPTPRFPDYSGPYKVGTVDLEIPTSDLPQHNPAPDPGLSTVQFRVFYPCEVTSKQHKHPKWLPDPQHEYVGAFMRFLGVGGRMADLIS